MTTADRGLVTQEKKDVLLAHLLELEKKTGKPLRTTRRGLLYDCPIENFAPGKDKDGNTFRFSSMNGVVHYGSVNTTKTVSYYIYSVSDSNWWYSLYDYDRAEMTCWVEAYLKARREANEDLK